MSFLSVWVSSTRGDIWGNAYLESRQKPLNCRGGSCHKLIRDWHSPLKARGSLPGGRYAADAGGELRRDPPGAWAVSDSPHRSMCPMLKGPLKIIKKRFQGEKKGYPLKKLAGVKVRNFRQPKRLRRPMDWPHSTLEPARQVTEALRVLGQEMARRESERERDSKR